MSKSMIEVACPVVNQPPLILPVQVDARFPGLAVGRNPNAAPNDKHKPRYAVIHVASGGTVMPVKSRDLGWSIVERISTMLDWTVAIDTYTGEQLRPVIEILIAMTREIVPASMHGPGRRRISEK